MLSFAKTYRIKSQKLEGVTYVIRRLSSIERSSLELENATAYEAIAEIRREIDALPEEKEDAPSSPERERLYERLLLNLKAKLFPVVLRAGVESVEGVEGDIDHLIAHGDDEMLTEMYGICQVAARMTAEQLKNWESAGTSGVAVAGQTDLSIAATAAKPA